MTRHAAIVTVTYDVLHQALDLPDNVELRGIVGLRLDPRRTVQLVIVHAALPEVAEGCWPIEMSLHDALALNNAESLVGGDG